MSNANSVVRAATSLLRQGSTFQVLPGLLGAVGPTRNGSTWTDLTSSISISSPDDAPGTSCRMNPYSSLLGSQNSSTLLSSSKLLLKGSKHGTRVFPSDGTRTFFSLPSMDELRQPGRGAVNAVLTANIAVFVGAQFNRQLVQKLAQIPYMVAQGEYWRLLTAGFLHLDVLHLLGSLLSVHWLGPEVERLAGSARFTLIYMASIVGGGLMQYYYGHPAAVAFGASGGIYGLFAAVVLCKYRNKHFIGFTAQDKQWIATIIALNVGLSVVFGGSIGHWAHLGGLLGGAATMWLFGPRYKWSNGYVVDSPIIPFLK